MSLERSLLDEAETSIKLLKKKKCQKCQRLAPFSTNNYIYIINLLLKVG